MDAHLIIPRIITALLSIFQAASLRDRLYQSEQRVEVLSLALEDIARINANSANPNALIAGICSSHVTQRRDG